jgi:MFS family permease
VSLGRGRADEEKPEPYVSTAISDWDAAFDEALAAELRRRATRRRRGQAVSAFFVACYCGLVIPVVGVGVASQFIGDFRSVLALSVLLAVLCVFALASIARASIAPASITQTSMARASIAPASITQTSIARASITQTSIAQADASDPETSR